MTPKTIIADIGKDRIVAAVGVDMRRVNRAQYDTHLPAVWYDALCRLNGSDLPRALFNFKGAGQ